MKGEHVERSGLLVQVNKDGTVQTAEEEQRYGGARFGRDDHRGHWATFAEGEVGAVGDGATKERRILN